VVLEEQGKPVAAAAGYMPNPEDYCPLRLSRLDAIAQTLNWSSTTPSLFRDRYLGLFAGDLKPFFLTRHASWIIENVAVLPEARGRGLGKALLKAMLEGRFIGAVLKPVVTVTNDSNPVLAEQMHEKAHHLCFIANSMNFPVQYESSIQIDKVA